MSESDDGGIIIGAFLVGLAFMGMFAFCTLGAYSPHEPTTICDLEPGKVYVVEKIAKYTSVFEALTYDGRHYITVRDENNQRYTLVIWSMPVENLNIDDKIMRSSQFSFKKVP